MLQGQSGAPSQDTAIKGISETGQEQVRQEEAPRRIYLYMSGWGLWAAGPCCDRRLPSLCVVDESCVGWGLVPGGLRIPPFAKIPETGL